MSASHHRKNLGRCLALSLLVSLEPACSSTRAAEEGKPFFDARDHRVQYFGPGRESAAPIEIDEVRIAYFGPTDPDDPFSDLWHAAQRAIDDANERGGYQGKPYRLRPAWSNDPWGNGVQQLARLIYHEDVWAVVGGVDGVSAHLAEQVVAKARVPFINAVSTDKTVNLANVPWVFSLAPGDHLLAPEMAKTVVQQSPTSFVLVSTDDHDSRELTRELMRGFRKLHAQPRHQYAIRTGDEDLSQLAREIVRDAPASVIVVAGADDSAQVASSLRNHGYPGTVVGGPAVGRRRFLDRAGKAAQGVVFPILMSRESPQAAAGQGPRVHPVHDYATALSYDAVWLLTESIGASGLNRVRIRDAIAHIAPWKGTAGTVQWDRLGRNTRTVSMGTVGRFTEPRSHPRRTRPPS